MNDLLDFDSGVYKFGTDIVDDYIEMMKNKKMNINEIEFIIKNMNCLETQKMFTPDFFDNAEFIRNGIEYCVLPIDEMIEKIKRFQELPFRHIEIKYNTKKKTAIAYVYQKCADTGNDLIRFLSKDDLAIIRRR